MTILTHNKAEAIATNASAMLIPLAGTANKNHSTNPDSLAITPPAPEICSACATAEMVELLYWMALLRGIPLPDFAGVNANISTVIEEVTCACTWAQRNHLPTDYSVNFRSED
ncbi:hypothetical protein [Nitrosomonas communis]|uniref:Uncharacterized protein n=1 Tax=Nitrosomonas communis TaxID=44574 RepID=A0A1H2X744_9PROT|nr:hypothetical protein [Nitrosomonas communis]SDW88607.1 hypothetical protein SAMN05421882_103524 [Nitrosomonas communis]